MRRSEHRQRQPQAGPPLAANDASAGRLLSWFRQQSSLPALTWSGIAIVTTSLACLLAVVGLTASAALKKSASLSQPDIVGAAHSTSIEHSTSTAKSAAIYQPKSDDEVLDDLPGSAQQRLQQRALWSQRNKASQSPEDLSLAVATARRFIEQARLDGDPRQLGYAQAALGKWWQSSEPAALLIRATIRQSRHEFTDALADLNSVLSQSPNDIQALLTRATIEQVIGDYPATLQTCERLAAIRTDFVSDMCFAELRSLRGDRDAYQQMTSRAGESGRPPSVRAWLHTVVGEMAERHGEPGQAEAQYRAALRLSPSIYLHSALCDLLLDQRRPKSVVDLVKTASGNMPIQSMPDALLLRLALAQRSLAAVDSDQTVGHLRERFEAARLRGETSHAREEGRFALTIERDAKRALNLAQQNWRTQREAADLRLLIDAAKAAGDESTLESARQFIANTGFRDARIELAQ